MATQLNKLPHFNKLFERWLMDHLSLFNGHHPYVYKRFPGRTHFRFEGVTKHLTLSVDRRGGCTIICDYRGTCIDFLCDNDATLERTKRGRLYCSMCIPKYRKFYGSLEALLISHTALPLAEWVREEFRSTKKLLVVDTRGYSYAKILNDKGSKLQKRPRGAVLFKMVPLIDSIKNSNAK
jgi:hypothetical protein